MSAVAVSQGGEQVRFLVAPPSRKPLLELVEDDQELLARRNLVPRSASLELFQDPGLSDRSGQFLRRPVEQSGFRLLGGRFDVDGEDVFSNLGSKPALTRDDLPQPLGP